MLSEERIVGGLTYVNLVIDIIRAVSISCETIVASPNSPYVAKITVLGSCSNVHVLGNGS